MFGVDFFDADERSKVLLISISSVVVILSVRLLFFLLDYNDSETVFFIAGFIALLSHYNKENFNR